VRNVPSRIQILRTLYPSILHCAHCSHKHSNITDNTQYSTVRSVPIRIQKNAHCTPKYSTARSVHFSIEVLRTLHYSTFHCAQCCCQHHPTTPAAPTRLRFLSHTAVSHVCIHNGQSTVFNNTKARPLTVTSNCISVVKLRNSLIVTNFNNTSIVKF
jgi:hypothetical protein